MNIEHLPGRDEERRGNLWDKVERRPRQLAGTRCHRLRDTRVDRLDLLDRLLDLDHLEQVVAPRRHHVPLWQLKMKLTSCDPRPVFAVQRSIAASIAGLSTGFAIEPWRVARQMQARQVRRVAAGGGNRE